MRRILTACLLLAAAPWLAAQPAQPLTLEQVMADPDWIGNGVEQAWWRWDSQAVEYTRKREDALIRDTFRQGIDGHSVATRMDGAARADLDSGNVVYDAGRTRMALVRNGDVFVRDLRSGALTQLTRSNEVANRLQWGRDGSLSWRTGQQWQRWDGRSVMQAADVRASEDPAKPPKADDLRDRQLRLIRSLREDRERRDAVREQNEAWRIADPTRAPLPAFLGSDVEIVDSALSPDGRWMIVATTAKSADGGKRGEMPMYVTESGYEETETVRTRVGRADPPAQTLWLVDVTSAEVRKLSLDALPGITVDPLAELRREAGKDALKGNRPVRLDGGRSGGGPINWNAAGDRAAIMLRAVDNKDRWIVSVEPAQARVQARHRLTDPGWINWNFNDFGWMPDDRTLWLLSEDTGFSHLYLNDANGRSRALTSGRWEASSPELAADGNSFYFLCNRTRPVDYEVCNVTASGGNLREVTDLEGVEGFRLSPDGQRLLVTHSSAYVPTTVSVQTVDGDGRVTLLDPRSEPFRQFDWLQPEIVQVPSKHGAGTIWGKYYGPKTLEPGRQYPIVLFVHGAGYLQNVHQRYPTYFREQMFHNLLVQQGYIVLDLDFRASEGYGRDWRTAIYRHMGEPELQDYLDGIDWLVANRQGNRDRVGIYGGSYGGFMTFMALFKKPGVFKAGAALRPVTDWSQYNHGYTANILNTPELDPEAYRRSSPLELAEGLQDHLLISHGMIDDNVFYRDSIVLAQRLIELRKDKWELASYPLERHGYQRSDSWYDQYRRIHELFEKVLKADDPVAVR
ncbi:MAG: prolyl oligopeptidase family serine peptidase [Pseudoxanthomonas suwonensis]|nr:prolyl oligopeptidase family serine peptidase [Pseudoxanthomonas suwonensis]